MAFLKSQQIIYTMNTLADEFDDAPQGEGAGMPHGNKKAGFVGLMIAKKHLRRGPTHYEPPAKAKKTPARFNVGAITAPSAYIRTAFPRRQAAAQAPAAAPRRRGRPTIPVADRSLNRAFRAGERANLTEAQLADVRAREAQRQRASRQRRALARIQAMPEGEAKQTALHNYHITYGATGGMRDDLKQQAHEYIAKEYKKSKASILQAINDWHHQHTGKELTEEEIKELNAEIVRVKKQMKEDAHLLAGSGASDDFIKKHSSAFSGLQGFYDKVIAPIADKWSPQNYKGHGLVRGGVRPTDKQFLDIVKTSYATAPPKLVSDFELVFASPTVDAWVNEPRKTIVVSIRGTNVKDKQDIYADASLTVNALVKTPRYQTDKKAVQDIMGRYNPQTYEYYLVGHSLGGAIINQLMRDFPQFKYGMEYNPAFQPYDLISQQRGKVFRNYTDKDPLYRLGGRLFADKKVVPSKTTVSNLGAVGDLYEAISGHSLSNFEGAGRFKGGAMTEQEHKGLLEEIKRLLQVKAHPEAFKALRDSPQVSKHISKTEFKRTVNGILTLMNMKDDYATNILLNLGPEAEAAEGIMKMGNISGLGRPSHFGELRTLTKHQVPSRNGEAFIKGGRKQTVSMPTTDYLQEHRHLINVLEHPTKKGLKAEAKKQTAEVKSRGLKLYNSKGKAHRGHYHLMSDGTYHTGKTHTARSKRLEAREA